MPATCAGSTVLGGATRSTSGETMIVGANATVTMLQGVAAVGDAGRNAITVRTNSTLTLGATSIGEATDNASTITVSGDTTGLVIINHVNDGVTKAIFFATTGAGS